RGGVGARAGGVSGSRGQRRPSTRPSWPPRILALARRGPGDEGHALVCSGDLADRRRLPAGREERGGVLAEGSPSLDLGQLSQLALVLGPQAEPHSHPLHRDPRLGSARDVRRSSSSIERAGGGWNSAASSSARPSASASLRRFSSVILPLVS